jgi:DNA-binding transcriptional LysR family regulator
MVARPLQPVGYALVASPAYLQSRPPITQPQDLLAHPCMSLGYGPFQNLVELVPADAPTAVATKLRLNTPITIASSQGLLNALQHGAASGIALMADFVARSHLADGRLVQVLPHWQLAGSYAPRMAYALHAPGPHIPPKLRAMLDYLQSQNASASASA